MTAVQVTPVFSISDWQKRFHAFTVEQEELLTDRKRAKV